MNLNSYILQKSVQILTEPLFLAGLLFLFAMLSGFIFYFYCRLKRINVRLSEKNSELEEINRKFAESEKKIQKLYHSQNKMYSVLAHDLRNPSNAILGFSQLLQRNAGRYTEEEIVKYSTIIYKSAKTLYTMLENILEWSKTQRDEIKIHAEEFDLHGTTMNIFALYELAAYSKKVDLISQIKQGTIVNCDKNIASTILRNLIDNALKFTPQNGQITVSAYPSDGLMEIWVADTGKGMDTQEIKQLFKVNNEHSKKPAYEGKGSGLGLLLCKEFVEMFQGKIWVESTPGNGSIFKFTLPSSKKNEIES